MSKKSHGRKNKNKVAVIQEFVNVVDQRKEQVMKKDTSEYVWQEKKINFELNIRDFPWTEKQKVFIEAALDKKTNYIICKSPPGTGKTLLSIYVGLKLLQSHKIGVIYFVRSPIESSSKGLGFIKGDIGEKFDPYIQPMMDHLNELLPPSQIKKLMEEGHIQSVPLGFIKGRTFNVALIIGEESEDLLRNELLLLMGRLGKYAKMILIGDIAQANVRNSGFAETYELFDDEISREKGIYCLSFNSSDIKRNSILTYIVDKFEGRTHEEVIPTESEPMFLPK